MTQFRSKGTLATDELIQSGLRRARVERSRAFYAFIEALSGRSRDTRKLSQG